MRCKTWVAILLGIVIIYGIWRSPYVVGLKLKIGKKYQFDGLLLDASDQILHFRGDDYATIAQGVNVKLDVVASQIDAADRAVEKLMLKEPGAPSNLLLKARVLLARGEDEGAIEALQEAKEIVERGYKSDEFIPSVSVLNGLIEKIRSRGAN